MPIIVTLLLFYFGSGSIQNNINEDAQKIQIAFLIHHDEGFSTDTVKIIYDSTGIPDSYFAEIDMPVCEDTFAEM